MAVSIAAHAVVLTLFVLHAPRLVVPREQAGPPEPIIPVLIMPRTPPPAPGSEAKPRPIRLHRRQLRPEIPAPPIPPLVVPPPEPAPAAPRRGAAQPRVTVQPSPTAQLRSVLRGSLIGCANPSLLSQAERAACDEQFGRNLADAPVLPPAPSAASRAALGQAAAAKEARQRYRRTGGVPNGLEAPLGGSGSSYQPELEPLPAPPPLRP